MKGNYPLSLCPLGSPYSLLRLEQGGIDFKEMFLLKIDVRILHSATDGTEYSLILELNLLVDRSIIRVFRSLGMEMTHKETDRRCIEVSSIDLIVLVLVHEVADDVVLQQDKLMPRDSST